MTGASVVIFLTNLDVCDTDTREVGSRFRKMASRISVGSAVNEGRASMAAVVAYNIDSLLGRYVVGGGGGDDWCRRARFPVPR